MSATAKHAPWKADPYPPDGGWIKDATGESIAYFSSADDLALAVNAVNCRPDMLEALKMVAASAASLRGEDWEAVIAAIAKAEGRS